MSDGRTVVSSWNTGSQMDTMLLVRNGINSNSRYREYLTRNGADIMKEYFAAMTNDTGSSLSNDFYRSESVGTANEVVPGTLTSVPYTYTSYLSTAEPAPGFEGSDLKTTYLDREQRFARQFRPTMLGGGGSGGGGGGAAAAATTASRPGL